VIGGTWRRWDTVILPPKIFDSIKSLPEDTLSFYDALDTARLRCHELDKVSEIDTIPAISSPLDHYKGA
jgi:hypothetical protein